MTVGMTDDGMEGWVFIGGMHCGNEGTFGARTEAYSRRAGTVPAAEAGDRLPVVVLTSLEENYMAPLAQRHGAVGCLAKPFDAAGVAAPSPPGGAVC